MLISRRGWVTVTLIVLFLLARSITGTVLEMKLGGDRIAVARIIVLAVWIAMLAGVLFGVESARFLVIVLLALGTAFSVAVFLDPGLTADYEDREGFSLWLNYLKFFAATNLVVVPLLAFSRPVRSYFSKMLRARPAMPPPMR